MKLSEILRERGYVYQHSSETLEEITDGPKRTVYLGIDPSADSLHLGNLMGLLVLRRFLEDGHKIILLTGGGTGMIGDPGGKSEERNLLDEETVARNTKAVAAQIRKVFGSSDFIEENNAAWLSKLKLLDFLRDVGKHFTVNAMIKKDTVKDRLDAESPISFTEFSYSLLQGYDYWHLHKEHGCDAQVGGSDQWSNILAGVDFIRRKTEKTVYALTWPLIVNKSTGRKFGKSEEGAVWLDPEKTAPFKMYQFFLNVDDDMVEELLLRFTLLPKVDIDNTLGKHVIDPSRRIAQRTLAEQVTRLVHGEESLTRASRLTEVLFGDAPLAGLTDAEESSLRSDVPTCPVQGGEKIVDVLVRSNLASSKSEARTLIEGGAIAINAVRSKDVADYLEPKHFIGGLAILRRGKREKVCVLTLT